MPNDNYLIGNEKKPDEDLRKSALLEEDFDAAVDDYFDFVLMEKDEFDLPTKTTVNKN